MEQVDTLMGLCDALEAALGQSVPLVIDDGPAAGGVASTVLKCGNEGFDILREGAISHASIEEALKGI